MEKIQKLYPVFKDYLWGGNRLKTDYHKKTDMTPCAESWELSFHPNGKTLTENGTPLMDVVTKEDLGVNAQSFSFFPQLIKLIDAKDNLSVQVHPSDADVLKDGSYGKTEMWVVVDADEDACLYVGFKRSMSMAEIKESLEKETILSDLNRYPVKSGDVYFIPSGTIHAIGKGCMVYEVQQNSDLTYRLYDYHRVDKNGNPRELHIEKALPVIKPFLYSAEHPYVMLSHGELLGSCRYFTTCKMEVSGEKMIPVDNHSFICITCVRGEGILNGEKMEKGDSYFVPCGASMALNGNMTCLVSSVRHYTCQVNHSEITLKNDFDEILARDPIPTDNDFILAFLSRFHMTKEDVDLVFVKE